MNICVLDDNRATADSVGQMAFSSCRKLEILNPAISCFTSSGEFLTWLDQDNTTVDVCFLDIYLKSEMDGIEIARIIKNKNYNTLLVFMTSYDNYYTRMVQAEPFRFLPKPFQYEDFHKVFLEVHNRIALKNTESKCMYYFKNNGITYSTDLNLVISISSYKRKIYIINDRKERISFYGKLDQIEKDVAALTDKFIRISKSYLVNIDFVDSVGKNTLTARGETYNISPKYKDLAGWNCDSRQPIP